MIKNNEIFEIVEPAGNYGDIVSRNVKKKFLGNDMNIHEYSFKQYNILLKDGKMVSDRWFEFYELDNEGFCIIGFSRTPLECALLSSIPEYCSSGSLDKAYSYQYGAVNKKGEFNVEVLYDKLVFNNENTYIGYYNGMSGYIDCDNGEQITPICFLHSQPFFEGKAVVQFEGQMGYISRDKVMKDPYDPTDYAVEPIFDCAFDFEGDFAKVILDEDEYVLNGDSDLFLRTPSNSNNNLNYLLSIKRKAS